MRDGRGGGGSQGADCHAPPPCFAVCSCALQRDILIQGRLYISPNWLCFYANLFGKDIKVTGRGAAHPGPVGLIPTYRQNRRQKPRCEGECGRTSPPAPITCGTCLGKSIIGLV